MTQNPGTMARNYPAKCPECAQPPRAACVDRQGKALRSMDMHVARKEANFKVRMGLAHARGAR